MGFALVALAGLAACEDPGILDGNINEVAARVNSDAVRPSLDGSIRADVARHDADLTSFALAAVTNSPLTASAQYRMNAARARIEEESARFQPQVGLTVESVVTQQTIVESSNPSFAGNQSTYTTLDATMRLQQTILDLPASAEVARAKAELEARAADVTRAQQDVLSTVLNRYVDGAEALERVMLAEAEVAYFARLNAAERRRVEEGDLRGAERGVTISELARARSDLAIAKADFRIRVDALCRMSPGQACPLPSPISVSRALPRPHPLTDAERQAVASAPEIQALDAGLTAALREVDRARTGNWPTISAYVEGSRRDRGGSLFDGSSLTNTVDAGLVFDWQFLQGGRTQAASERELNEAYALGAEREGRLRDRVGELEAAADGLEALWQNDLALQSVQAARMRAVRDFRAELGEGTATDVELSRAQLEVVRASILRRTTRRTYLAAMIARQRATGRLDANMVDLIKQFVDNSGYSARVYAQAKRP